LTTNALVAEVAYLKMVASAGSVAVRYQNLPGGEEANEELKAR
jgi:hypothetical protein